MRALAHTLMLVALSAAPVAAQALAPETGGGIGEIKDGGGTTGLVLGQTTLTEVRQLYASRKLQEPLANARAARPLTPAPRWTMGSSVISPRYRVDGADGYYTLYFDAAERLVLAVNEQPKEQLSREDFQRRYPQAKLARQAAQASILEVALSDCVTLSAMFAGSGHTLLQAGYGYTCGPARPLAARVP